MTRDIPITQETLRVIGLCVRMQEQKMHIFPIIPQLYIYIKKNLYLNSHTKINSRYTSQNYKALRVKYVRISLQSWGRWAKIS